MNGDISVERLADLMMSTLMSHPTARMYPKWTCPGCGERVTSTEANKIYTQGYVHEECGTLYEGDMFGVMIEISQSNEERSS